MDPSGAVVPGAVVTITEKDKGFSRSVTTSKDGSYQIPLLPPGRYVLGAQKEGFRKFERGPLTLLVNQHLREDIKLELGQAGDSIVGGGLSGDGGEPNLFRRNHDRRAEG